MEFYDACGGNVYVAFSGGKDSTVLLHLVRSLYPDTPAVFVDTGLEYPELKEFVKTVDNVETIRPEMSFKQVIDTYGYPAISKKTARMLKDLQNPHPKNKRTRELYLTGIKSDGTKTDYFMLPKKYRHLINCPHKISDECCNVMKKKPSKKYEKDTGRHPFIGTMAAESRQRELTYLQTGCNILSGRRKISKPLSIWTEEDIWKYIKIYDVPYSKIYDMGEDRTGCMFCMFGAHIEPTPNRFQRMKNSHPKIYQYCMDKLKIKEILTLLEIPYE